MGKSNAKPLSFYTKGSGHNRKVVPLTLRASSGRNSRPKMRVASKIVHTRNAPLRATLIPYTEAAKTRPLVFTSWQEAHEYSKQRARAYPREIEYYASDEYKALYPELVRLREIEFKKIAVAGEKAMQEAGVQVGDTVEYVQVNPWGMPYVQRGTIVLDYFGVPQVKFSKNQVNFKNQARWHKGFKKIRGRRGSD